MGLSTINASSAYARGATGKNITIGITDSGLDNSHSEIDRYQDYLEIARFHIQITSQIQDKKDMEPWLHQLQLDTRKKQ